MPRVTKILEEAQTLARFANLEPEPAEVEYFRRRYPDFAPHKWWDTQIGMDGGFEVLRVRDDAVIWRRLFHEQNARVRQPLDDKHLEERWREIETELKASRVYVNQWQITQTHLRNWWRSKFKDDIYALTALLGSIFDPEPFSFAKIAPKVVREMYPEGVPENVEITIPGRSPITSRTDLREGYIPMQRATVYLFENSWRARFCKVCNRRFVAAQPKSEFCNERDERGEMCSHKHSTQRKLEWWNNHGKQWRKNRRATRATKTRGN